MIKKNQRERELQEPSRMSINKMASLTEVERSHNVSRMPTIMNAS
jgi:hypothetical protein